MTVTKFLFPIRNLIIHVNFTQKYSMSHFSYIFVVTKILIYFVMQLICEIFKNFIEKFVISYNSKADRTVKSSLDS